MRECVENPLEYESSNVEYLDETEEEIYLFAPRPLRFKVEVLINYRVPQWRDEGEDEGKP